MTWMLLRRSLVNVRMLLAVLLSVGILILPLIMDGYFNNSVLFPESGLDILAFYTIPFATSSFVIFAGIFPGLPYAYSYLEERNCGYLKFIQTRLPRKRYAAQKILFTGLSGGIMMLLPAILVFSLLDIISVNTTPESHQSIWEVKIWGPYIYLWGGRFVLLLKAILMFLFGVMWAELALLISLIVRNKYVALVLPFLLYEVLWILMPGSCFNPVFLVRADFDQPMPIAVPYLIDVMYIVVLAAVNWILLKRQGRK